MRQLTLEMEKILYLKEALSQFLLERDLQYENAGKLLFFLAKRAEFSLCTVDYFITADSHSVPYGSKYLSNTVWLQCALPLALGFFMVSVLCQLSEMHRFSFTFWLLGISGAS